MNTNQWMCDLHGTGAWRGKEEESAVLWFIWWNFQCGQVNMLRKNKVLTDFSNFPTKMINFHLVCFETMCQVAQAGFELTICQTVTLNSWFSSLLLPSEGILGVHDHTRLWVCLLTSSLLFFCFIWGRISHNSLLALNSLCYLRLPSAETTDVPQYTQITRMKC